MSSPCSSTLVLSLLWSLPHCLHACSTPGLSPPDCNRTCVVGFFGQNCSTPCPRACLHTKCHAVSGTCFSCQHGHIGPNCSLTCPSGFFGQNCSKMCPKNCLHQKCDFVKGTCKECVLGYEGPICGIRSELVNVTFVSVSKLEKADDSVQPYKLGANRNAPVYVVVGLTMCIISTCCAGVCYYFAKGSKSPSGKKTSMPYTRSPGRVFSMPFYRFSDAAAGDDLDPIGQRMDVEDLKTSAGKHRSELESRYGWESSSSTTTRDIKGGSYRTCPTARPPTDTSLTQLPEDEPDVEDLRHVWLAHAPMRLNKAANYSRELFFKTQPQYRKIDVETGSNETSRDTSATMSSEMWSREGCLGRDGKEQPRVSGSSGTDAEGSQKIFSQQRGTSAPLDEIFVISNPELAFSVAEKLGLAQRYVTRSAVTCVADERPTVTFATATATATALPEVTSPALRTKPTARSAMTSEATISQSDVTCDSRTHQTVTNSAVSDSKQQRRTDLILNASFPPAALTQDRVYAETTEPLVGSPGLAGSLRNTVMRWTERLKTPKMFKHVSIELKENQSRVVGNQHVGTPSPATLNEDAQEKLELSEPRDQGAERNKHGKRAPDVRASKARKSPVNKNATCRIQEKALHASTYDEYDSEDDLLQALNSTNIVIDHVKSDNHRNTNNRGQCYRMSSLCVDSSKTARAGPQKRNHSCSAIVSPALSRSDGHTLDDDPFAVKAARSLVGRTPGYPENLGAMTQIRPASCRTSDQSVGKIGPARRVPYWGQGFKLPSYMAHLRELQTHKQHSHKKQPQPPPLSATSTSEADSIELDHRVSSSAPSQLNEHFRRNFHRNEDGPVQKKAISSSQFQTRNTINLSDNHDQAKATHADAVLVEKSKHKLSNKVTFQPGQNHRRSLFVSGPYSARSDILGRFQAQTSNALVVPETESTEESSLISSASGKETTSTELTSSEHTTETSTESTGDTGRMSLVEQEASRERDENILGANIGSHLRDFVSLIPKSNIVLTRKKNPALEIKPAYLIAGPLAPAAVTNAGNCRLGADKPQMKPGDSCELDSDIQRLRSQIGVLGPTADSPGHVWRPLESETEHSQVDKSARDTLVGSFKDNRTILWSDTDDSREESRTPESDTNNDEDDSCPLDPFMDSSGRVDYDNFKPTLVFDDNFVPTIVVDDKYTSQKVVEDSIPNTNILWLAADKVPNDRSRPQQHKNTTKLDKDKPKQISGDFRLDKATTWSVIGNANEVRRDSRSVRRISESAVDASEQIEHLPEPSRNRSKYDKAIVRPAMSIYKDDKSQPEKGIDTSKVYAYPHESEYPNICRLLPESSTDATERPRETFVSTAISSEEARQVSGAVTESHSVARVGSPGSTSIDQSRLPQQPRADSTNKRGDHDPVGCTTTSSQLLTSRVVGQDSDKASSSFMESDGSIQNTSSVDIVSEKPEELDETRNKTPATQRIINSMNGGVQLEPETSFQMATVSCSSTGPRGANRTGHNTQFSDNPNYKATSPNYKPETSKKYPNTDNSHSPLRSAHHDTFLKDQICSNGKTLRTLSPLLPKQACGLAKSPSPRRRETTQSGTLVGGEKSNDQTKVTPCFFSDSEHKDIVGSFIATKKEFSYSSLTGDIFSATTGQKVSSRTTAQEVTSDTASQELTCGTASQGTNSGTASQGTNSGTASQGTNSGTASQVTNSGTASQGDTNGITPPTVAHGTSSQGISSGTDSELKPTLSRYAGLPDQSGVVSPLGIWLHTRSRASPRDINPLNLQLVTPLTSSTESSELDEKHTGRDTTEFFSQTENLSERYYDAMEYAPPKPGEKS